MLFYCSLHPEWDDPFANTATSISELLGAIALTHDRNTGKCFAELERLGIFLGNGAFETVLIQRDPFGQFDPTDTAWARLVVNAAKGCLQAPLWYCLSLGGKLYLLCCFPRLTEGSEAETKQAMGEALTSLQNALQGHAPALRLIASDVQYGEAGIFRTFNDLSHALDYFDFRTEQVSPILLDSEQQLHGALIRDMSVYRQLSVAVGEQLSRSPFSPEAVSDRICDALMANSVPSMESVHHHVQVFMLTFTEYLGSAGLVDASYMSRHNIVYRAMGFEREAQLRSNFAVILEELHRQNRTLRKIGRQKRIQSIRDYVESHITDPELSVGQVSELFHLGPAQLAKQFRYYYGVSLHRFIQQARYQHAQGLLAAHSDWSMRQVAREAGYTDISTMYRAFRALGNVTPGALRDSLRQDGMTDRGAQKS